jgi:hypothetical protein
MNLLRKVKHHASATDGPWEAAHYNRRNDAVGLDQTHTLGVLCRFYRHGSADDDELSG